MESEGERMGGIALFIGYLALGALAGRGLFAARGRAARLWLGLTLGLMMMMWLPSLWAFPFGFTAKANWFALGTAALLSAASYAFGARVSVRPMDGDGGEPPLRLVLWLVIPAALLFALLQYTHYFREADGALFVGQSTYGDICMHSAIITSLKNAPYPPEYSILPGNLLGYPFLTDALSASMALFGTPLSLSMTIPGTVMGILVFWGFLMLGWRLVGEKRACAVAFLLLFLNGGLGFLYAFDLAGEDASAIRDIFTGFYLAPANMPDLNLRWVNILCDMLLPQRTFLGGCAVFLPAVYLLSEAYAIRSARVAGNDPELVRRERMAFLQLGIFAGATPMIHTHLFLTLGLITVGAMAHTFAREKRFRPLGGYLWYGVPAVLLALPQLLLWTLPQTAGAGGVRIALGWVNNEGGLRDETLWFWVKNMGLPFLLLVPAWLQAEKRGRVLMTGAALAFLAANVFQFQTLLYDNNKILYGAFMVFCPFIGSYLVAAYDALRGIRARPLVAACFLTVSLLSGALTVGREVVSDYQIFSSAEVNAAEYLSSEAPDHATVLTGYQHNNLATVLAGKNVVCGPGNFLSTHGLSYSKQWADAKTMFESPGTSEALFREYEVGYVLLSPYEWNEFHVDAEWLFSRFALAFEAEDVCVLRVEPEAWSAS